MNEMSLIQLVLDAGTEVLVVLIVLLILSIVSWVMIVQRWLVLNAATKGVYSF